MATVSDYTALISGNTINGSVGKGAFVSFSFPTSVPIYLSSAYAASGLATFRPFSDEEKANARAVIRAYEDVSGLTFFEVAAGDGDIKFMTYELTLLGKSSSTAGFAYYPDNGNGSDFSGDVFIDRSADSTSYAGNGYFYHQQILLHEVGHTLGLKHPFDGSTTLVSSLDNIGNTVMSYTFSGGRGDVLGQLDLDAIRYLYGGASNKGSQAPGGWSWNESTLTLSQNGSSSADKLYGIGGNDVIQGFGGDDTLVGRGGANRLFGNDGNDVITGGSGNDLLDGGDGNDNITGGGGIDTLVGGAGNDMLTARISGGIAGYAIDGGIGIDTASLTSRVTARGHSSCRNSPPVWRPSTSIWGRVTTK